MPGHSDVQVLLDPGGQVTVGTIQLACTALNVAGKAKSMYPDWVGRGSRQVVPPSTENCHWTLGVGLPEAAAENTTVPETMLWLAGCVVTTGAA